MPVNPAVDGDFIVWTDYRNGNGDIYLYDIQSGQERRLTSERAEEAFPDISDGRIVWMGNNDGYWNIYSATVGGRAQPLRLPVPDRCAGFPTVAPTGFPTFAPTEFPTPADGSSRPLRRPGTTLRNRITPRNRTTSPDGESASSLAGRSPAPLQAVHRSSSGLAVTGTTYCRSPGAMCPARIVGGPGAPGEKTAGVPGHTRGCPEQPPCRSGSLASPPDQRLRRCRGLPDDLFLACHLPLVHENPALAEDGHDRAAVAGVDGV